MNTDKTRTVEQSILLNVSKEVAFNALITPSIIQKWWGVQSAIVVPKLGGAYVLAWGESIDKTLYTTVATLSVYDYPNCLVMTNVFYDSPEGPLPFEAELLATFSLETVGESTKLTVLQEGIPTDPIADDFFEGNKQGWKTTLQAIQETLGSE